MKIDFSAPLKDFEGKPMVEKMSASAKDEIGKLSKETRGEIGERLDDRKVTLGVVSLNALTATFNDEGNISTENKMRRFRIALKVSDGGSQELETEDAAELKKVIGKAYGPLIVGRAFELIERVNAKETKAKAEHA